MASNRASIFAAILLLFAPSAFASQASAPSPAPADPALIAAENLIGKALFLRGFYAPNNLAYDATGKIEGSPKSTDWTLAAINVLKASRHAPDEIELEGVRVAIRYNPDAHEFQRHPLNDEKMKLLIKLAPDSANSPNPNPNSESPATVRQLTSAFAAIFSIGIDPALQRSMPPLWRHYFDPNLPWPPDALTSETIYPMFGQPGQPKDVTPPILAHKVDAQFTDPARHDNVKGPVQLRITVDPQGVPQRIFVTRPLGYGLEERAAEAIARWRFNPAVLAGRPIAAAIVVNLDFETAPPPR